MESKKCNRCQSTKPIEEFGVRYGKPQPYCKICNKEYNREHYQKNKQSYKEDALNRRWQIRRNALDFLMEYAKTGCTQCGEKDFVVLEFDHIDPSTKKHNISTMVSQGTSIRKLKEELDKCQILCANCHRRKTAEQEDWYVTLLEKTNQP